MVEDKSVLQFSISKVIKVLIGVFVLLLILSVGMNIYYYTYFDLAYVNSLFSLDKENNIPTRFASGLLVLASFLFYIIYRVKKKTGEKYTYNWLGLALIFLLMGLDESVVLHEQTSQFVKAYVKGLHFAWVIPGALFVLVFAAVYLKFYLNLETRWKKLFFISAALFLTGAIGFEVIGNFFQASYGQNNISYAMLTNLEETLEFAGTVLLLYTEMSYLKSLSPCYRVDIKQ